MKTNAMFKKVSPGIVLPEAWRVFSKNIVTILKILGTIWLPLYAVGYLWPSMRPTFNLQESQPAWFEVGVLVVIFPLILSVAAAAIMVCAYTSMQDEQVGYGTALKRALQRWPAYIKTKLYTVILLGLLWAASLIVLSIVIGLVSKLLPFTEGFILYIGFGVAIISVTPSLFWYITWCFALPITIVRQTSGRAALAYSKRLVKGSWWSILAYVVAYMFLAVGSNLLILQFNRVFYYPYWISLCSALWGGIISSFYVVVVATLFVRLDTEKPDDQTLS